MSCGNSCPQKIPYQVAVTQMVALAERLVVCSCERNSGKKKTRVSPKVKKKGR